MNAFMPHFAPLAVLLFLGTVALLAFAMLVFLYGTVRRSRFFSAAGGIACAVVAGGYALLLFGFSFASREVRIPAGSWKYFCEIDCHLAHSVAGVQTAASLGSESHPVAPHGKFVVIRLKTWFDEKSVSSRRGSGPLTPSPRRVVLLDDTGHA